MWDADRIMHALLGKTAASESEFPEGSTRMCSEKSQMTAGSSAQQKQSSEAQGQLLSHPAWRAQCWFHSCQVWPSEPGWDTLTIQHLLSLLLYSLPFRETCFPLALLTGREASLTFHFFSEKIKKCCSASSICIRKGKTNNENGGQ